MDFASTDLKSWLIDRNSEAHHDLQRSYLGFVVIKPVKGEDGTPIIGRTVLKTPRPDEEGRCRFATSAHLVSLAGLPLQVEGMPFQVQDRSVGACAQIALWSAIQPAAHIFGIHTYSPAEITRISSQFPSETRVFPAGGLNISQMITFLRSIGLEVEVIRGLNTDIASTAIKAYIESDISPIATLQLTRPDETEFHAVAIAGYACDSSGRLERIYIHDDQMSPYTAVTQTDTGDSPVTWNTPWSDEGYTTHLVKLLIPVYHKIRLDFYNAYARHTSARESLSPDARTELYLKTVQDYKKFLLSQRIADKDNVLTLHLPRFLWVIRVLMGEKPSYDSVYDGTTAAPRSPLAPLIIRYT